MDILIRKGTEQDFPAIFQLIREFSVFQGTPEKVSVTPEQMIAEKDHFRCFVAETPARVIIGFASYFLAYYSWSGKAIYLDDLYVKKDFRQQGAGKKLLEAVIHQAKIERCKKVRWQVSRWNTNAIAFYQKLGAVPDETEINCELRID